MIGSILSEKDIILTITPPLTSFWNIVREGDIDISSVKITWRKPGPAEPTGWMINALYDEMMNGMQMMDEMLEMMNAWLD